MDGPVAVITGIADPRPCRAGGLGWRPVRAIYRAAVGVGAAGIVAGRPAGRLRVRGAQRPGLLWAPVRRDPACAGAVAGRHARRGWETMKGAPG